MTGDRIELRGLRLLGRCGAEPHERERLQPLEIDLDVVADLVPAAASDRLSDTVDYGDVCDAVAATVAAEPVALLEHLAQAIVDAVLGRDRRIDAVTVTVRKLAPPVAHHLASAGVRITRAR